jgi:hypothetical protein
MSKNIISMIVFGFVFSFVLMGCGSSGPTQKSLEQSQREIDDANQSSGAIQDSL